MTNEKIKHMALGLVLGVILATAVAAVSGGPVVTRFQIGATSTQAYVIDTATGQVWNQSDGEFYKIK